MGRTRQAPAVPPGNWNRREVKILKVLHYNAYPGEKLAKLIDETWEAVSWLLRKDKPLRKSGLVDNAGGGRGYFRTDARPWRDEGP